MIEALGARFAATKAEAAGALAPLAAGVGELSAAQRLATQTISHKLAGVSAIFGEPALGDAARRLDEALSDNAADPTITSLIGDLLTLLSQT